MRKNNNNKLFTIETETETGYDNHYDSFLMEELQEIILIVEGLIQLTEEMVINVMDNGADPIVEMNHIMLCLEAYIGRVLTTEEEQRLLDILIQVLKENDIHVNI